MPPDPPSSHASCMLCTKIIIIRSFGLTTQNKLAPALIDGTMHYNCASLTVAEAKRINASKEMWMCNHNGCHAVYGDIFDSD